MVASFEDKGTLERARERRFTDQTGKELNEWNATRDRVFSEAEKSEAGGGDESRRLGGGLEGGREDLITLSNRGTGCSVGCSRSE